jgi:MSHA pilin protein MshC
MKLTNVPMSKGFTVIELVIVIILISVIGVVTLSRFLDGNAFSGFILRDQIISLSRTAQQSALGRADVILTITPSASLDTVTLTSSYGAGATTINSVEFDLSPNVITGSVNNTDSCSITLGSSITNAAPFIIRFDELGDLDASGLGAGTAVTDSVKICLNDNPVDSVCISPGGFAYAGDCDV